MTHRSGPRPATLRGRFGAAATGAAIALAVLAPGGVAVAAPAHKTKAAPVAKIGSSFLKKANGACGRLLTAVNANGTFPYANFDPLHPKRSELPKVGAFFERAVPAARAFGKELEALGTPAKGARTWREIRSLALTYNKVAIAQAKATQRSDVTAFVATVKSLTKTSGKLTAIAVPAGFSTTSACGQIF